MEEFTISRTGHIDDLPVTNQWQQLPSFGTFPYEIEFIGIVGKLLIRFKQDGRILEGIGIVIEKIDPKKYV